MSRDDSGALKSLDFRAPFITVDMLYALRSVYITVSVAN